MEIVADWLKRTFNTGGRRNSEAIIMFGIQGLTHASQSAVVRVNNDPVGRLFPYSGEFDTAGNWYTQTIMLNRGQLNNGNNELQIEAVRLDPQDTRANNVFDDFQLKNVVCFFHQAT